jgi:sulfonate transport system substrate-binding protein
MRLPRLTQRFSLLGWLAAASILFTASAHAAEPSKTLRIGYQKFNSVNILKGTGALEKALADQGVKVSWHEFAAGPQLVEALSTGAINLGHAADAPSVFAQASGKPVVYLAAEQPYPLGIGLLVRKDSKIESIADLKGQRVATGRGWNAQYLLALALEEGGSNYKDIQPAYVSSASDAIAALESGSVEAATLWDPFLAAAELQLPVRNLRDGKDLTNNRTFYLTTAAFADANPTLIRTFFVELAKTNEWANAHPQEVAELLAPQLGITPQVLLKATERRNYSATAITDEIVAEQQKLADTFVGLGVLPKSVRVADAIYPQSLLP